MILTKEYQGKGQRRLQHVPCHSVVLCCHKTICWRRKLHPSRVNRDLKIQDGREDDGAPKDGKDWA